MADKVRLKVRKPSADRGAEDILETVQEIVSAITEGYFDPYIDVLWKAFDDRIRNSQEEDGDGEVPTRERAEKLRPMRIERDPVVPIVGRHYRLHGEKYSGVVVMYIEMAGFNNRGAAMVLVEIISGNNGTGIENPLITGQRYKVPLIALEEIPDMKKGGPPQGSGPKMPYGHAKCQQCGSRVEYSGRGRPRKLCDNCMKTPMKL